MSRASATLWAFGIAIVATVVGLSQSLLYYNVPPIPLAVWFPSIVLFDVNGFAMILVSFVQFPAFAVAFALGIRRWPMKRVIVTLASIYAGAVATALILTRAFSLR